MGGNNRELIHLAVDNTDASEADATKHHRRNPSPGAGAWSCGDPGALLGTVGVAQPKRSEATAIPRRARAAARAKSAMSRNRSSLAAEAQILRPKRDVAFPGHLEGTPLLSSGHPLGAPVRDSALPHAEGGGELALRSEELGQVAHDIHGATSHPVNADVKLPCEVTAPSAPVNMEEMPKRTRPLPKEAAPERIALRLEATRLALGLRAVDICKKLGLGQNQWSNYKGRKSRPGLDDMILFAEEYGVPLDWIYRGNHECLEKNLSYKVGHYLGLLQGQAEAADYRDSVPA